MALTATSGSGSQSTTQNPQTAAPSNTNTQSSSGLQPGTAADALRQSSGGIALHATDLPSVNLNSVTASQGQATATPTTHHFNPALGVLAVLFFVIAIAMFWLTSRSEKITT